MAKPSEALTGTLAAIRFGYGLSPSRRNPKGPDDLLRELRDGASAGLFYEKPHLASRHALQQERGRLRKEDPKGDKLAAVQSEIQETFMQDVSDLFVQRSLGHGFFERLCAFWADHFTISTRSRISRTVAPAYEVDAIRPNVMGRFDDFLIAIAKSPLMQEYLDQRNSIGPNSVVAQRARKRKLGLNENLAREILELHTLGSKGSYSQEDVREFARLLTGYFYDRDTGRFTFEERRAEPGPKWVLGRSYGGKRPRVEDAEDFLRDLARHPRTAQHLAEKLAVHFVSDNPDPGLVQHLTETYLATSGDLPSVYQALLEHPASWDPALDNVKPSMAFLVSALRATDTPKAELQGRKMRKLLRATRELNQFVWRPIGPDGWPEEDGAWITPPNLAARIRIASRFGQELARDGSRDPRLFAEQVLGEALKPATAFAVGAAPERWEGFALTFASAEFNRR